MNTSNTPAQEAANQPLPEVVSPNKALIKSKTTTSKIPMINQAWIEEILHVNGLEPSPLATRAGQQLATELEAKLAKQVSREKIIRLIRSAVSSAIGK